MSVKLKIYPRYIEIHTDKAAEDMIKLSSIPYTHSNRTKKLFLTTIRNLDLVLKLFRGIENSDTLPEPVKTYYDTEMRRRSVTEELLTVGLPHEEHWLRPSQRLGVALSKVNKRFGFYYDTRTGKTPMSLQIIHEDLQLHPEHKWLILCPLILIDNAWLPDAARFFPDMKIQSLHAATRDKRLDLFRRTANVYVANIESFISYEQEISKLGIHGVFVDESSTLKSKKSEFGKRAVEFSHTCPVWYLLSGSPAPNNESEYYRQLQSIDYYGVHESFAQFAQYFFTNIARNPIHEKYRLKPERREEFLALLAKYSIFVDKEDVLTTPGREFIVVETRLPEVLKEHYVTMREKLYVELLEEAGDDENKITILAPSAAAKINKLNQITSGFIFNEGEPMFLNDYRITWLQEILNDKAPGEQVLIWAYYREEFKQIKELLGANCEMIYGGTTIAAKNEAIRRFKAGEVQYLVANPASADKGLTLTNSHICVYYSLSHSYELFKQSSERIYGDISIQPKKCFYYIMTAKGTIDKLIYEAVIEKRDNSMDILNHLKSKGDMR